jgi:VCBS repeat-containing protein
VPATDARGFAHVDDPNVANHGSDIADLGAFEDVHAIEVTTLSDTVDPNDGVTSLREALAIANADTGHADTITFDPGLAGGTLHLASTLDVTNAVTIDGDTNGDGKADITITGDTLGNDVATNGITDIAASQAKAVGLGTALTDNVQIFHATGDLTLNSLVLTGGSSSGLGGAIYAATGTTLTVTDSMVSGNYAGLDAGGLFAQSNASLTNTTVSGNVSAGYSGGLGGGVVTLINSTISGNTANRGGGGLSINSGTLINSTVSGNDGGGLLVSDAVTVTNSILLGNSSASGSDVTFFVILPGPGTLTFTGNNILGSAPTNFTNVTGTYSLLDSTSATDLGSVFASVGNDPSTGILSGQLADNGGPVETIALAATATNPALDAGDDALAPSTDARGDARVDIPNAGDDGTNFSDLGAFEVQSIPDRAPSGIDGTVTTLEDTPHVLAASDFAFNDLDNNALKAVEVTTLPTAGTLTDNGHAVHSGDFVSAADIAAGELVFTPTANANGIDAASFTFQVQDSGGTAGGVDLDPTPNTLTIDVTPVNDAPSGSDGVVVTAEDSAHTFAAADFSFSDIDGNALKAVEITTLPAAGTLTDNGAAVAAGQFVSAADIAGGKLVFTPTANGNGTDYTHFTFQVQDDGGLANGGVDTDPTPRTLTIDVNPVNDAPVATVPGTAYHATAKVALPLAGTGLAVSDVDGGIAVETVKLAVGVGTIEATAGNSGVAMVGDGTAALTLFGTIAELDALLDGSSTGTLSYLDPTDTPVAATTLTLAVDDNGATGSGGALSDSQSVMIDIAPAPETAPVVADDAAAVSEFATVAGDVITGSAGGAGADHDADGDPLTVTAVAGAEGAGTVGHALLGAYGTLTLDADGSFSYRADHASPLPAGASETDSFTYTVSDGRGGTGTATLAVTITGTATGDDAANHLVGGAGNDTLDGNGGDDFISGGGGGDVINGGDGSDVLRGNLGGDILLGRNGDDHLAGGAGNDTLVGGRGDDILVGGMGNDSLAGNAGNDLLNGRAGDDTLVGGVGRDVLDGEGGADLLTGGAGRDTFLFDTRPIRGNVDTVTDFTPGFDHIALSRAVFAALGPAHHLAAAAFSDDGTAHTRAEHVIYNPTTGDLSYDANGSMAGGMHHFATLEAHLHVTSADFLVVA